MFDNMVMMVISLATASLVSITSDHRDYLGLSHSMPLTSRGHVISAEKQVSRRANSGIFYPTLTVQISSYFHFFHCHMFVVCSSLEICLLVMVHFQEHFYDKRVT